MSESFTISADNQKRLLLLAREAIRAEASGEKTALTLKSNDAELSRPSAVFVTLHKHGRLRGCIGTTQPLEPLLDAVSYFAHAAAFEDPRFPSVQAEEVPELHIEISVLSPMREVASPEEIVPHVHGVMVRKGRHAGLFLPQVWEQLPDKEQFMGYLCAEKAGLPFDAWKQDGMQFYVFTVVAFEEETTP